ncbi:MAG: hypothetical protein RJA98_2177 [Pseudomonadota bacterium]|jgi:SagB-type dehydrogenase family enzyme
MAEDTVAAYHQRSKHAQGAYAAGPDTLDWDAQPKPFRDFAGAPLTALPLLTHDPLTPWSQLFQPGAVAPRAIDVAALGQLFELSLALAAWKHSGPDRWAVRINPSSGNLHPTEAWLISRCVPGLRDGLHHYAPEVHALAQRAVWADGEPAGPARAWLALSSIAWREAWKYGERAFRYTELDLGHAVGALRGAAALCGWCLQPVPLRSADLAALLGLNREADYRGVECDEAELLFQLRPLPPAAAAQAAEVGDDAQALLAATRTATWFGTPNRLDAHPMYRWPVIDAVSAATRVQAADAEARTAATPARLVAPQASHTDAHSAWRQAPAISLHAASAGAPTAASLIRQRRSAQRFDARARMPLAALWPLLRALNPAHPLFGAQPAHVHALLFVHRVDGLPPGAYLLPRSPSGQALLARTLPWPMVPAAAVINGAPADVPLLHLADNPALAGTLRTLNCHQALGADAMLAFAFVAEFQPLPTPAAYRARLQEAGLLGHALYLQAEAWGLRGTGIGCYFDDALHQLIGLPDPQARSAPLQSVYHFTVGLALDDPRIASEPPYAHRPTPRTTEPSP